MSVAVNQASDAASQPQSGKRAIYSRFLDAPDQACIRADLTTFFGPNADTYLQVYEGMRAATGAKRILPRSWNWSAFLLGFVWFFYRKMYAYGALLLFAPMVVGYLFGSVGGGGWAAVWFMCGRFGKGWYVTRALDRIAKADKLAELPQPGRLHICQAPAPS